MTSNCQVFVIKAGSISKSCEFYKKPVFLFMIVESGKAARTIAAYIDLNPVRAGMVVDPAEYRWSSYGEAVGGGNKGNGKKAREGLVRAYFCDQGVGSDAPAADDGVWLRARAGPPLGMCGDQS